MVAENEAVLEELIGRTAKIGYDRFIEAAFLAGRGEGITYQLAIAEFKGSLASYTMLLYEMPLK